MRLYVRYPEKNKKPIYTFFLNFEPSPNNQKMQGNPLKYHCVIGANNMSIPKIIVCTYTDVSNVNKDRKLLTARIRIRTRQPPVLFVEVYYHRYPVTSKVAKSTKALSQNSESHRFLYLGKGGFQDCAR